MPTRNVNLTDHFDRFINEGVASGRFGNASEVVREGLRLLEQREKKEKAYLEWFRAAVQEGIDDMERGAYVTLNSPQELDDSMEDRFQKAKAKAAGKWKRAR